MMALAHYDPNTGQFLGVWVPPRGDENQPHGHYVNLDHKRAMEQTVNAKGTEPTWEDWFDQLGDGLPYGGLLVSVDVRPDLGLAELFGMLVTR